ncbi:unnamed protein product, partial [Larinioides sclopetarius]
QGFLLLPVPSEKPRICLKKCANHCIAGVTPALLQVVVLLSSFCNFFTYDFQ